MFSHAHQDFGLTRLCRHVSLVASALCLLWPALCNGQAPRPSILCRNGDGVFDAAFRNSIGVHVGAAREPGLVALAKRSCAAKLMWEKRDVVVEAGAAQIDLDAFGIDLGDGVPIAAFQVKKSESDCCMEYRIFSLEKPPRLLRTISGSQYFSASDIDMDGRVEIWADDGAAINGFESLTLGEMDSLPAVVLRLEHGSLVDVSAEFQSNYDTEIARLRNSISGSDLQDFKKSDGKLTEAVTPASAERLHRLRGAKVKVLEIVWNYLYSGRESEAWHQLGEMWPPADVDRIHAAIVKARAAGVHAQVDSASVGGPRKKKHAPVFDAVRPRSGLDSQPTGILLQFQSVVGKATSLPPELRLDLIIDVAGKVRATHAPLGVSASDVAVTSTWKFIPAFKDGRPVASHLRISVWPKQ